MNAPEKPLVVSVVALSPDQMKLILANQELFLSIYREQMALMIQEQIKTNSLLGDLIQAMAEGGDDLAEGDEPVGGVYLDGSPIRCG